MNWITKIIKAGEKIKTAFHERASKEDIAKSDWTSCCRGPMLKKDLAENLWVCPNCSKHHRIKPNQRFDILFGKNNYEVLKDGSIRKNGKDFASLDSKQFDIWRSYKKLHLTKKTGWFKNKDIDISIDEDIFLFMISDYFDLDIPFREIED